MKKRTIVFIILDILMIIFYFLTYGPISYFRELLITTAMYTKEHKYLARTLYSEKTISKVMSNNIVEPFDENTNIDDINFEEIIEQDNYESIYEEQVLKHEQNDIYKIVNLSGNGYNGYMIVLYDASRISLEVPNTLKITGKTLTTIASEYNAIVAINAGGFADIDGASNGGTPTGTVIKNGEIIYEGVDTGWPGGLIGFNNENILVLTTISASEAIKQGMKDAVEFGPFLVVNGKKAITRGNGGSGVSPRTVIAQRKDGIVLLFIIDGRQPGYSLGISLAELTDLVYKYGAYNAANLDGGASTTLVVDKKLYNKPAGIGGDGQRRLPNAWVIK